MPKLNIENPRFCPFRKSVTKMYDLVGPEYEPTITSEIEQFEICIGESCMLYKYDGLFDTEECLLGRPYEK